MKISNVINIYYPMNDPQKMRSPYVYTLYDHLRKSYNNLNIIYGKSLFWKEDIFNFDIIHIQWPDDLLLGESMEYYSCEEVISRLILFKQSGGKIIVTCHNFKPHFSNNLEKINIYGLVYGLSDMILHLGEYSKKIFNIEYPNTKNVLLYHHVYDDLYLKIPSREEAIKKLKLSNNITYILCFGAFRNKLERFLIISLSKILNKQNIEIIAPSFIEVSPRRNIIHSIYVFLKKSIYKNLYPKLHIHGDEISNEELPYYYAVSNLALIQRIKILNSGNVLMGLFMGKVVVGPNVGNVGWLLNQTNNPTFNPNSQTSILDSIFKGLEISEQGYGRRNRDYVLTNFSTSSIANKLFTYYKSLLS